MARFGSAPDLSLTGVPATVYGKKPGGSRPTSAAHVARKRPGNAFDYEYSVVESLPNTHDAHGWPVVQKEKKTNTPIVGRSRANSAGTVKSFHSEPGGPRTNKSALLRQRLIAIERNQNSSSSNTGGPKKPKNSRVVSASRRKPMKSQENSHRSDKSTAYVDDLNPSDEDATSIKKPSRIDAASRRSNGSVYSFLGETEPHDDDHSAPKANHDVLKLNLDVLNDTPRLQRPLLTPKKIQSPHPTVPKMPLVENTTRKKEMLDDIFQSTLPKATEKHQNEAEKVLEKHQNETENDHDATKETLDLVNSGSDDEHANFSHDDEHLHSSDNERFMFNPTKNSKLPEHHGPSPNQKIEATSHESDDDHIHATNVSGEHVADTQVKESHTSDDDAQANHSADKHGDEHILHDSSVDEHSSDPKRSPTMHEKLPDSVNPDKIHEQTASPKTDDVPNESEARPPSVQRRSARTPAKVDSDLDQIFQQQPRRKASSSTQGEESSENTLPHQRPQALSSSHHGSPSQSFGHFDASSPGARASSSSGFFHENFDTDRTTHRPSAREFYANQRSVRNSRLNDSNSKSTSRASQVDDAESLVSVRSDNGPLPTPTVVGNDSYRRREKISAGLNGSQNNSTLPVVPDPSLDKYDSIKDYLHQVKAIDDERRSEVGQIMTNRSIQLSNTPPNVIQNNDVQDSLVVLVHQMIEEKRALTDLCAKLLQQMQITTSKLVEIETRQEKSLIALIEHRNGIKIEEVLNSDRPPTKNYSENIDWKTKYEDFVAFHSDEIRNLRQKYENEIERLNFEFHSSNKTSTPKNLNLVENESQTENLQHISDGQMSEISVQTDDIFHNRDDSDDETDAERATRGIMSDDDGFKNRLLNVSEEKTHLESLLGERNTEIERLKSELAQVVDEQAEFASHLSSKLTNRIEGLQGENTTLKNQLQELERRCTELASLLNANLAKTETVEKD